VGRLDTGGDTDLYVNLRCLEWQADRAILYAGGGILPSSDWEKDWEETQEKMRTMKDIL
jgi:isochorismate synthase